jgi:outer membrane lipoprotein-sorting protein
MKLLIILLAVAISYLHPQKKEPEKILEHVKEKFSLIKDYVVDVNIKVDVDFLKVPETKARIYYKQPNKVHFESDGFALLPKEGIDFSPVGLLKDEYTAIYQKLDTLDGYKTDVIKVIPTSEESNIILTTLWVDETQKIIRRVESSPKVGGTFSIDLKYNKNLPEYPLPEEMVFTFNVERMNLPTHMTGEVNKKKSKKDEKGSTTGKVFIDYKNYKINKGIPDSVFEEKKSDSESN